MPRHTGNRTLVHCQGRSGVNTLILTKRINTPLIRGQDGDTPMEFLSISILISDRLNSLRVPRNRLVIKGTMSYRKITWFRLSG